jgi:mannose-1-phosphate guanylyltransferase
VGYHVLVLAGGSGTRLWPLSRSAQPKHLLPVGPGGATLLRTTVERVLPLTGSVRVVTAEAQAAACRAALEGLDLPDDAIIAEPEARGTGPALGLAVRWILDGDPDAVISSVHADHHIDDDEAYRAAVLAAAGWAAATDGLATVGLVPTEPATGFGYVALAEESGGAGAVWTAPPGTRASAATLTAAGALPAARAAGFVEKPSRGVAEEYVRGGRHLWNTGLFAWPGQRFWTELDAADATLAESLRAAVAQRRRGDEPAAGAAYAAITPIPVEPLVFERTPQLTVVRAGFSWSDLGSFADLHAARVAQGRADDRGNVTEGQVLAIDASNSLVMARSGRLVAVVGVDDLVVVDTDEALLVVPRKHSQRVKEIVDRLRASGPPQAG